MYKNYNKRMHAVDLNWAHTCVYINIIFGKFFRGYFLCVLCCFLHPFFRLLLFFEPLYHHIPFNSKINGKYLYMYARLIKNKQKTGKIKENMCMVFMFDWYDRWIDG